MSEKTKRILMTLSGVIIAGFSAGMFQYSALGMDPFQTFAHGIWTQIQHIGSGAGFRILESFDGTEILSYGILYMILNLILLVFDFLLDRKKIGIATFINLFLLGYVVDFSNKLWNQLLPNPEIGMKILFLILAVVLMCFGSSLYFTSDLGVSTYDAISLALSEKKQWNFKFVRITSDVICTMVGFLFGFLPGIGTIVTAFFMGPLIEFFNKKIARPLRYGSEGAKSAK